MNQEYFTVALSTSVDLGLSLVDMGTVAQFEVKNICTVPGVANFWYGVVNFKGSLLWILDSDRFLMQSLMSKTNGAFKRLGDPMKVIGQAERGVQALEETSASLTFRRRGLIKRQG